MSDQDVRQMARYPSRLELGPAANDQRSPFRAVRRVHTAPSWASRWSARACSSACLLERVQPPAGEPACAVGLGLGALSPQDPAQLDADPGGRPSGSAGPWRRGQTSRRAGRGRARRPLPRGGHVWRPLAGLRAGTRRVADRGHAFRAARKVRARRSHSRRTRAATTTSAHACRGPRQRQAWRTRFTHRRRPSEHGPGLRLVATSPQRAGSCLS